MAKPGRVRRREQDGPGLDRSRRALVAVPEYRRVKVAPSQASWLVGKSGMVNTGHWAWGTPRSESDLVERAGTARFAPSGRVTNRLVAAGQAGSGTPFGRHGLDRDRDT